MRLIMTWMKFSICIRPFQMIRMNFGAILNSNSLVLPASMRQLNKGVLKGNLNLGLRAKSSIWFTTEII